MRVKNTKSNVEVYAVSGTNTVVLSMDMKNVPQEFLGFSFERIETASKKMIWLEGQKFFQSVIKLDKSDLEKVKGQKYPTYLHPIQSFLWKDFTVMPGLEYTYTITAMTGKPSNPQKGISTQITIKAEKNINGQHGIYFNRGVSGSQSYAEQFKNEKPFNDDEEVLDQKAADWLSRGLYEGMKAFINLAKKGQKIRGACYEFHYPDFLEFLKGKQKSGVDINVVYDVPNYGTVNKTALTKAKASSLVTHVRDNQVTQAHNKFFVLLDKNEKALQVWTGSTNISAKGIFGHCNTGHIISDPAIADQYFQYWKLVYQNLKKQNFKDDVDSLPNKDVSDSKKINDGISVFFSPRNALVMLQTYADLLDSANQMVCAIYPFNIDKRFEKVFKKDRNFIRYILLDKHQGYNTFQTNDKDVEVTAGAYIPSEVDNWVAETNAGKIIKAGVDYLHNKILLVDPLGDEPVVISGSANYSENSTIKNDENTLVIKGNDWVADVYFTEYVRLFDHFSFREWLMKNKDEFNPFLDEKFHWSDKYFQTTNLAYKRKMIFRNMVRATDQ